MNGQQLFRIFLPLLKPLLANKYAWFAMILGGMSYVVYDYSQRDRYSYEGVPKAQSFSLNTWTRVFRNEGFMVGYSEWRGNPLWVTYHLRPIGKKKTLKRPSRFQSDWRSIRRVSHDDYLKSGYDRGHMAPNYAISNIYGRPGQLDTFVMTNITPQRPHLNQKIWQRLEDVEANKFATWFKDMWVITGPIFDKNITKLRSGVEIPDAFYKIYIVPSKKKGDAPKTLSFIIPQKVKGNESLSRYVSSIDEIEKRTGFDFLSKLPDHIENKVEASTSSKGWRLKQVANLRSRY
ncbi:MAG: DNA/RNA non-specific endonuclease [Zetaproteobacteria bacterium]|nr:DNA/RNA non-specific endonuclease [Zetaproteobacteria bacterium]